MKECFGASGALRRDHLNEVLAKATRAGILARLQPGATSKKAKKNKRKEERFPERCEDEDL